MGELIDIKLNDFSFKENVYMKIFNIFELVNHLYDKNLTQFNNIEKLKLVLESFGTGIKMSYEPPINDIVTKFALYVKNEYNTNLILPNKYYKFNDSCNELIFNEVFKPIAIPPRILYSEYKSNEVDELIKQDNYIITKINDGTMITLYFDGMWQLSTVHKMDIGDVYFMGNKCYYELFYDCIMRFCPEFARRTNIEITNGLKLDLDRNCSYTFIFHHKNFHPCDQDGIWQVQCVNTHTLEFFTLPDVPCQEAIYVKSLDELKSYLNTDYSKFGFILRSRNLEYRDIIIRSEHLDFIRNVFYSSKLNYRGVDHTNRYLFLVINAYLTPEVREKIRAILNVEYEFAAIKKYIDIAVTTTMLILKSENYGVKLNKPTGKIAEIIEHIIDKIGIQDLKKKCSDISVSSIFRDYLSNNSLAYEYMLMYLVDKEYNEKL